MGVHVKTYKTVHSNTKLNLLSVKTAEHLMDRVRTGQEEDGGATQVLPPNETPSTSSLCCFRKSSLGANGGWFHFIWILK